MSLTPFQTLDAEIVIAAPYIGRGGEGENTLCRSLSALL
jgi:hypothetical protein